MKIKYEETFEQQFPSLKGMGVGTRQGIINQKITHVRCFSSTDIQQHCLDKQIVEKEYIHKNKLKKFLYTFHDCKGEIEKGYPHEWECKAIRLIEKFDAEFDLTSLPRSLIPNPKDLV